MIGFPQLDTNDWLSILAVRLTVDARIQLISTFLIDSSPKGLNSSTEGSLHPWRQCLHLREKKKKNKKTKKLKKLKKLKKSFVSATCLDRLSTNQAIG